MSGLNKVMIIGRLGQDPSTRYSQNGTAVTNFSIATSETWNDKTTGQKQEKVEFHNCVSFGKQAEILEKYLKKGSQVYIEGKLQTSTYDKEGQTHYSTKIVIDQFQFLGGKSDNQQGGYQAPQQQNSAQGPAQQTFQGSQRIPDDDIPF